MAIDVTPEVARSHAELNSLCEKFEVSVDELCTLSVQEFRSHTFYECELLEIAAACADALLKFPDVSFYEDEMYENAVADAEKTHRQQKSELAETLEQKVKTHDLKVTNAENALSKQIQRLKGIAVQSMRTVQSEVEKWTEIATTVDFQLSRFTQIDPTEYMERNTTESDSKGPYSREPLRRALADTKKSTPAPGFYWLFFFAGTVITSGVLSSFLGSFEYIFFFIVGMPFAMLAIIFHGRDQREVGKTLIKTVLITVLIAAAKECAIIRREMQADVKRASAAHDEKVNELLLARSAAEARSAEEKFSATCAKKIEDAKAKKDQALAYIQEEFQTFDRRLCRCLDKFQALVDTWATENAYATSILDENRVQNLSKDAAQNGSTMTRIGTVSLWDFTETQDQVDKHTDDAKMSNATLMT